MYINLKFRSERELYDFIGIVENGDPDFPLRTCMFLKEKH
jgi:hypothetical protein